MIIYACSDLHVSKDHFSPAARAFLEEAHQKADLTLLCGDLYEGSWRPLQESVTSANGKALWELVQGLDNAVILLGNHDWTLKKHVQNSKHPIKRSHLLPDADGRTYYATHGWMEYDLPVGWLAPIYHRILPRLPVAAGLWTRWKSPGAQKRKGQMRRYWRHVRKMSNRAIFNAIDNNYIPIWGHSHRRQIDLFDDWLAINCGAFVEGEIGGIVIEHGEPREWSV
jgi:UDP-2,3-diacylglucosamine pyrophosphatase LpxH